MAKKATKSTTSGKGSKAKTTTKKGGKTMKKTTKKTQEIQEVSITVKGWDGVTHKGVLVPSGVSAQLISRLNQQDRALATNNRKAFRNWIMKGKFFRAIKTACKENTQEMNKRLEVLIADGVINATGKNERAAAMFFHALQTDEKYLAKHSPKGFQKQFKGVTPIEDWRESYCDKRVNPEGVRSEWRRYKNAAAGNTTHSKKKGKKGKKVEQKQQVTPVDTKTASPEEVAGHVRAICNAVVIHAGKNRFSADDLADVQATLANALQAIKKSKAWEPIVKGKKKSA